MTIPANNRPLIHIYNAQSVIPIMKGITGSDDKVWEPNVGLRLDEARTGPCSGKLIFKEFGEEG